MSRLGDLLRTERLRQKMTPKQVARKCGVSESYIIAVENGTRIIQDEQARRILKKIGLTQQTEADFSLDDIAATVDLAQVQPTMAKTIQKKAEPRPREAEKVASTEPDASSEGVTGSVWLDALQSVLKNVPVMNAVLKPVDHRLLPILQGTAYPEHEYDTEAHTVQIWVDDEKRNYALYTDMNTSNIYMQIYGGGTGDFLVLSPD